MAGRFIRYPTAIVFDPRLSPEAKLVAAAFASYADASGRCFPAIGLIAQRLGLSRRTVQRHLRAIEACGHIVTEKRRRVAGGWGSNSYLIVCQAESLAVIDGGQDGAPYDGDAMRHPVSHRSGGAMRHRVSHRQTPAMRHPVSGGHATPGVIPHATPGVATGTRPLNYTNPEGRADAREKLGNGRTAAERMTVRSERGHRLLVEMIERLSGVAAREAWAVLQAMPAELLESLALMALGSRLSDERMLVEIGKLRDPGAVSA